MAYLAPMLPAVVLGIIGGALADRFGTKNVVTVGVILCVPGIWFRYMAENFITLFILCMMSGLSAALMSPNAAKILGAWFSPKQLGFAMGLYFSGATVGSTLAVATTALFPSQKAAYTTAGIVALISAITWIAFVRNKPKGAPDVPPEPILKYMKVAARSKNTWFISIFFMLIMGATMAQGGGLINALITDRGVDPVQAGFINSVATIGMVAGILILPAWAGKIGRYKPFLGPLAIVGGIITLIFWKLPVSSYWFIMPLSGFLGAAAMPLLKAYPVLLDEIGPEYAGSAGGIISTMQLLGAFFIPSFIIAPVAGLNFQILLYMCGGLAIVAGIIALLLPEVGHKMRQTGQAEAPTSESV
ncbi:MAG: MFS transporter [Desulfitobacteriia bacterium]|jgi:MFS family permease